MPFDAAYATELKERTVYELWVLDLFRQWLFRQSEAPEYREIIVLGDCNERGDQRSTVNGLMVGGLDFSKRGLPEILNNLRYLAFGSVFKLQDMLVEWILSDNGVNKWQFSRKIKEYDRLFSANKLNQPSLFKLKPDFAEAFWELYRYFEPARSAIIHKSTVAIEADGVLKIKDRYNKIFSLDNSAQSAYCRCIYLLSKLLQGEQDYSTYYCGLIKNSLHTLDAFHGKKGFCTRRFRHRLLLVKIPLTFAKTLLPYACGDDVSSRISNIISNEKGRNLNATDQLFISLEIEAEAEGRKLIWKLPPERTSSTIFHLREDDPELHKYLTVQKTQGVQTSTIDRS